MRSNLGNFAVGEATKSSNSIHRHFSHHGNYDRSNNNNFNKNNAIPYHARENSMPFSYGFIDPTSIPLKSTSTTTSTEKFAVTTGTNNIARDTRQYKNDVDSQFDFDFDFGLDTGSSNIRSRDRNIANSYELKNFNDNNISSTRIIHNFDKHKINSNNNNVYNVNNIGTNGIGNRYVHTQNSAESRVCNFRGDNIDNSKSNENKISNGVSDGFELKIIDSLKNVKKSETNEIINSPDATKMIKTQSRLTSPLLVRKTLGNNTNDHNSSYNRISRSPTRLNAANTIANTYYYSYGNNRSCINNNKYKNNAYENYTNGDIFHNDVDRSDKFIIKGNDSYGNYNYSYNCKNNNINGTSSSEILRKTPIYNDFNELSSHESHEKVLNQYDANNVDNNTNINHYDNNSTTPRQKYGNGTIKLPSTLLTTTTNSKIQRLRPSLSPTSSTFKSSKLSQNYSQYTSPSQYNYNIEFNLNLDDVDNASRWNHHTNPTTKYDSSTHLYHLQSNKSPQKQLYETHDIPLTTVNVERNYHTISSSLPLHDNINNNNNSNRYIEKRDIYSNPTYEERYHGGASATTNTTSIVSTTPTSSTIMFRSLETSKTMRTNNTIPSWQLRTQHFDQSAYGNEFRYGHEVIDRSTSPIYAVSTKKANNTCHSTRATTTTICPQTASPTFVTECSSVASTSLTTTIRPDTPAFPVTPRTPFVSGSNIFLTNIVSGQTPSHVRINGYHQYSQQPNVTEAHSSYSTENIYGHNYRPYLHSSLSITNSEPQEVAAHLVKFAKDSSKYWYKPNLSREEAISLLVNASPGTFLVRDSTTYKNAYGLVLRVVQPPPGTTLTGRPDELVRHFLIEPTTRGVRLKGCLNEPVFTSLSALVYEHSVSQLALPCLLNIPEKDLMTPLVEPTPAQKQLLTQGAACNVLWLYSCDTESLTGEEAIRKAIRQMHAQSEMPIPTEVHFKVSQQGITLTDNTRRKFFRKHYTADIISYCAIDPDHRLWTLQEYGSDNSIGAMKKTIFAFVARTSPSSKDNQCHVFCDLIINQPASAIVSFANRTLPTEKQKNYVL